MSQPFPSSAVVIPRPLRPVSVGDVIRSIRTSRRMSQAQLATTAGVSTNLISRVERGATNYRRATLEAIATALQTDVATLMGGGLEAVRIDDEPTRQLLALWRHLPAKYRQSAIDAVEWVMRLATADFGYETLVQRLQLEEHQLGAAFQQLQSEARRLAVQRRWQQKTGPTCDAADPSGAPPPSETATAPGGRTEDADSREPARPKTMTAKSARMQPPRGKKTKPTGRTRRTTTAGGSER